jgi:hypothetical protein
MKKVERIATGEGSQSRGLGLADDFSDEKLASLLNRLRTSSDAAEIQVLSCEIEQLVFHKQFESA